MNKKNIFINILSTVIIIIFISVDMVNRNNDYKDYEKLFNKYINNRINLTNITF